MQPDGPPSGWQFVAEREGAAELLGALLRLEGEQSYTKDELAEAADVPLKQLYLADSIEDMVQFGVLEPARSREGKDAYTINEDSEILAHAAAFQTAMDDQL
jgi:hypothetical protein